MHYDQDRTDNSLGRSIFITSFSGPGDSSASGGRSFRSIVAVIASPLILPKTKRPPEADQSPGPSKTSYHNLSCLSYLVGPSSIARGGL